MQSNQLSETFPTGIPSSSNSSLVLDEAKTTLLVSTTSSGRFRIEAPEIPEMNPTSSFDNQLCNPNHQLMGDEQSSLQIALLSSVNPSSTFSVDVVDTDVDVDIDSEDDLYSREAKEQAARERAEEAANAAALTVLAQPIMEVQHQSVKRARPLSPSSSPDRLEKIPLREVDLNNLPQPSNALAVTLQQPPTVVGVDLLSPTPAPLQSEKNSRRRPSRLWNAPTPEPQWPDQSSAGAVMGVCKLLAEFRASLVLGMQSISSAPEVQPGLESLTSVIFTAVAGLEKLLQPPRPASAVHMTPPTAESVGPTPARPVVPSPPLPPPPLGSHAVTASSWATVVARSSQDRRTGIPQSVHPGTPALLPTETCSANRVPMPQDGPPVDHGRGSPSTKTKSRPLMDRQSRKKSPPPAVSSRRGLRALLAVPPHADGSAPSPPAAEDIQRVLFAPAVNRATMETSDAPGATNRKTDEPVTYLHVMCPTFSAAARREPREAWRLLLLSKSKGLTLRLRPLDILPVSAIAAEIFIPESQLPVYRAALQEFIVAEPPPLSATDFRRRSTAYRNSYFKSYRMATLLGFSPGLREDLLFSLWNDVLNPAGPPSSKYRDLRRIVQLDLEEFRLPDLAAP